MEYWKLYRLILRSSDFPDMSGYTKQSECAHAIIETICSKFNAMYGTNRGVIEDTRRNLYYFNLFDYTCSSDANGAPCIYANGSSVDKSNPVILQLGYIYNNDYWSYTPISTINIKTGSTVEVAYSNSNGVIALLPFVITFCFMPDGYMITSFREWLTSAADDNESVITTGVPDTGVFFLKCKLPNGDISTGSIEFTNISGQPRAKIRIPTTSAEHYRGFQITSSFEAYEGDPKGLFMYRIFRDFDFGNYYFMYIGYGSRSDQSWADFRTKFDIAYHADATTPMLSLIQKDNQVYRSSLASRSNGKMCVLITKDAISPPEPTPPVDPTTLTFEAFSTPFYSSEPPKVSIEYNNKVYIFIKYIIYSFDGYSWQQEPLPYENYGSSESLPICVYNTTIRCFGWDYPGAKMMPGSTYFDYIFNGSAWSSEVNNYPTYTIPNDDNKYYIFCRKVFTFNGGLYMVGNRYNGTEYETWMYLYAGGTSWSEVCRLPNSYMAEKYSYFLVCNGKIHNICRTRDSEYGSYYIAHYVYDVRNNSFSQVETFSGDLECACVYKDTILIYRYTGGEGYWLYYLVNNTLEEIDTTVIGHGEHIHCMCEYDDCLYMFSSGIRYYKGSLPQS